MDSNEVSFDPSRTSGFQLPPLDSRSAQEF